MFLRHRQVVDFQGTHVRLDGFLHIGQRGILRFAVGDPARQAGALGEPEAIFPAIDENLSHTFIMAASGADTERAMAWLAWASCAVYLHLRVLTGTLRVLHALLTGRGTRRSRSRPGTLSVSAVSGRRGGQNPFRARRWQP